MINVFTKLDIYSSSCEGVIRSLNDATSGSSFCDPTVGLGYRDDLVDGRI